MFFHSLISIWNHLSFYHIYYSRDQSIYFELRIKSKYFQKIKMRQICFCTFSLVILLLSSAISGIFCGKKIPWFIATRRSIEKTNKIITIIIKKWSTGLDWPMQQINWTTFHHLICLICSSLFSINCLSTNKLSF